MKIEVPTMNGYLFDRYSKFAPADQKIEGKPSRSFPIFVSDVPKDAKNLAVCFYDYDSVPVCGFTWIHWLAATCQSKIFPLILVNIIKILILFKVITAILVSFCPKIQDRYWARQVLCHQIRRIIIH